MHFIVHYRYSMGLFDDEAQSGTILAASGTVFNKVLMWDIFAPKAAEPAYSLEGHEVADHLPILRISSRHQLPKRLPLP